MKKLLYTIFLFCLFVACDNDDDVVNEASVSFTIAPSTRANEMTSFSDGDAIGVYAVDKATGLASSGNICDNKKYVFSSLTQSFTAASQTDFVFNYDNKDLVFYVYYPYSSSIDDATNVMHVLSGVREDDFLVAQTSGSGNTLPLNFTHLLSKIRVNYTPDQASSDLSMTVNTYKACVINLANNQIDKVGNRAALLLEKTQSHSLIEFTGVILPQTYTQSTLFGTITAGGKPYSFSFPADRTFVSGEENKVSFMGSENQYIFSATPASINSIAVGSTTSLNVISTKSKTINGVVQPGTTVSIGYSLISKPDWVTISGNTIIVAENSSLFARSGDIIYTQETSGNTAKITVTQSAASVTYGSWVISVSASPTNIASAGGTSTISATASRDVFTNGSKTGTETATPTLAASGTGFSLSGTTLTASNNTGSARSCTVTASYGGVSKTCTVTQSAVSVTYGSWVVSVSASPTNIVPAGGTSAISATASRDVFTNGSKTGTETATPTLAASGTGFSLSGTTLTASNNTGAARSCVVAASHDGVSKTVTVTQSAVSVTYGSWVVSVSASPTNIAPAGGTSTISATASRDVFTNGSKTSTQTATPTLAASGTGFSLSGTTLAASNNTGSARSCTVTASYGGVSKTCTVTQSAVSVTYGSWVVSVSASPTNIAPAGGTSAISATASRDVFTNGSKTSTQTATPTLAASGTGFSLSGTTLTASNNTGSARSCTVTASYGGVSKTCTVTQSAAVITYDYVFTFSDSSTSQTWTGVSAVGATKNFTLNSYRKKYVNGIYTVNEAVPYSGTANVSWITLTGSSVIVADNNTTSPRGGVVTFTQSGSGKTLKITVTQLKKNIIIIN